MIRRVSVRDYQSLSHLDIELAPLTAIVGPTGSGKSALVRALSGLFFNQAGADFIREGTKKSVVSIELVGGVVLEWSKAAGSGGAYRLLMDGQEQLLTRVGRELNEIARLTGVREIDVDGQKIRLQFDQQFDAPFLLSSTGGQAAKLLARVSKLDVLVQAQVLGRRQMEQAKKAASMAQERARALSDQLALMPDYEALVERWAALDLRFRDGEVRARRLREAQDVAKRRADILRFDAAWQASDLVARQRDLLARVERHRELALLAADLRTAKSRAAGLLSMLLAKRAESERMEASLHDLLSELEVCPLCGRPM